ncbi:hypothetical protein SAMN05421504_105635 [Amycolatopsis xylanica]|uniref:Uncharacterized protein n=1 Tax=Amycolatopsis xylanica TaxID=589385 RepID=A0A1H3K409_9PSEU|nr:hypothetical protein [Amycolatopsis xylanica]SDY46485.1 hypothetical protein SAMN05421504_105635 [Amycolatopsis xylanica]
MNIACPQCAQVDQVQSVPAVHQGGSVTHSVVGGAIPVSYGDGNVTYLQGNYRGTSMSALARELDPTPPLRGGGCFLALAMVLLIPAVFMTIIGFLVLGDHHPEMAESPIISTITVFAPAGLLLAMVALFAGLYGTRVKKNRHLRQGTPESRELWAGAWYCHRCGGVFLPEQTRHAVPARQLMSPSTFRSYVWRAGGYPAA